MLMAMASSGIHSNDVHMLRHGGAPELLMGL